jgi:hypothetical protein
MAYSLETSCFGRIKGKNIPVVAISWKKPRGRNFPSYDRLAPQPWMLKLRPETYLRHYTEKVLDLLDPQETLSLLNGKILCCWERPGVFCHRRIVAEWIQTHCGIVVPEWGWREPLPTIAEIINGSLKSNSNAQMTLL